MTRATSSNPDHRAALMREGLLVLTRLLVTGYHAGTLSESLEVIAESLSVDECAAYEADKSSLVLVAHRGLSLDRRTALERLSRTEEPWFIAARAVRSRKIVVETDVHATTTNAAAAHTLQSTVRLAAISVPLVAGREVIGALVFFHKRPEMFDLAACTFLETAAGVVTLARKSESAERPRREEPQMGSLTMAGMLAAHFADDIRGPLAAIGLVLKEEDRVLARLTDPNVTTKATVPQLRQLVTEAQLALRQAQTVTDQIAGTVRARRKEPLVFAELLRDAIQRVAPAAAAEGIFIAHQLQGEDRIWGRRSELVPAFVAMLMNAVQASQTGPRTRRPTVRVAMENDPRGVAVTIEDTGPGVSADVRARIFDPFFSTNEGSTGIGLTLAKHAIIGHFGHIELSLSTSLGGALFRVVLPRAAGEKKERRTSLSSATLRKVTPRPSIVWIDQDSVFVAGARRALANFDMTTASTMAEAEPLILREVSPEIIFCALDLPDGSGLDLHAAILKKNPDLAMRFVFVTDGVLSPERAAYVLSSGCPTILKPIDLDDIVTLVKSASGDRSEQSAPTSRKSAPNIDDPFDL